MVYLDQLKQKRPEVAHLISGGLDLILIKKVRNRKFTNFRQL
jgi:phenylalanine-4-hydroxylase